MNSTACHAKVNELLIAASRGLLQYVGECWPWSSIDDSALRNELEGLVKRQQNDVARLVNHLSAQRWPIDFSNYPTEFTDKHFLSIDFLLPQIIENEAEIKSACESALTDCREDAALTELIRQILANEIDGIDRLKKLCETRSATCATAG